MRNGLGLAMLAFREKKETLRASLKSKALWFLLPFRKIYSINYRIIVTLKMNE